MATGLRNGHLRLGFRRRGDLITKSAVGSNAIFFRNAQTPAIEMLPVRFKNERFCNEKASRRRLSYWCWEGLSPRNSGGI